MRVSSQEIAAAFRDVLNGTRPRDDVAAWAARVRAADDADGLQYDPPSAASAIWNALAFLTGVDLRDGPDSYLHSKDDIEEYWRASERDLSG